MRTNLVRRLAACALVVPAMLVGLGAVAQAQPAPSPTPGAAMSNQSSDANAGSGGASASNGASATAGNQASTDPGAAAIEGDVNAGIVHEGDNEATINQQSRSRSGDAVAGAQVTGIVSSGGNVSVRKSNSSEGAEATSGEAFSSNVASLFVGNRLGGGSAVQCPSVGAGSISGNIGACVLHDGDNAADISQAAISETGDAVAGSQITGVVTSGNGSVSMDNTNSSEDDEATSGNSDATNTFEGEVGDFVGAPVNGAAGDAATGAETEPGVASINGGTINATIVHEGDNDLEVGQDAASTTGDAVAGGQVTGAVASGDGSISIANDNASEDSEATSGNSDAANFLDGFAGDVADDGVDMSAGAASIDADTISADIVHDGDNSSDASQDSSAATGDAVAGGQVTGAVASGTGNISIVGSSDSEDAESTSGEATASNLGALAAADASDADVDPGATAIDAATITAGVVHEGDNDSTLDQSAGSATGDAVAGGQIIGAVASAGNVAIDVTNSSEDDQATSGNGDANNSGAVVAGNAFQAGLAPEAGAASIDVGGLLDAGIVHDGENAADLEQQASGSTGDAVGGGQVVGAVASGGDVSIVGDATSEDSEATSGDASGDNSGAVGAGNAYQAGISPCAGGCADSISADTLDVGIAHEGDNDGTLDQAASGVSGDAVAGGAVMGVIGSGGSVGVDSTIDSEDAQATSGDGDGTNTGAVGAGNAYQAGISPEANSISGGTITAGITHDGENAGDLSQDASGSSGDAVAGGSVIGAVGAGGDMSIVSDLSSEGDEATSGNGLGDNSGAVGAGNAFQAGISPGAGAASIEADLLDVDIVHEGDNAADLAQDARGTSGDAVAGGQVVGVVGSGGDVAMDLTSDSEDSEATSGDGTGSNSGAAAAGNVFQAGLSPEASSISADTITAAIAHDGDNDTSMDQSASGGSGDAVAGGQVMGAVAAGDVDIVASNTAEDAQATSGDGNGHNSGAAAAANAFQATVNPGAGLAAISGGTITADIVHEGDNDSDLDQAVDATSGDAVGGGQIAGVVTTAGGSVSMDLSNESEDADSTSGDADATNDAINVAADVSNATIGFETAIEGDIINADIVHDGDNDASTGQDLSVAAGDAVAGGQIVGVVAGGAVDVVQDNASEDDQSTTGNATGDQSSDEFVGDNVNSDVFLASLGLPLFFA